MKGSIHGFVTNRTSEKIAWNSVEQFRLPTCILGGSLLPKTPDAGPRDAPRIIAGCMDGLYEIDSKSGEFVKLDSHESYVSSVVLGPDGQIISAGYDGAIQWFDRTSKKRIRRLQAHDFWSWEMAISPSGERIASVSGQYLAGDYEYSPRGAMEPCVKVFDARTGKETHAFEHLPPVQTVTFSPDSRFVAAANLMGDVRVYDLVENRQVAGWRTNDFTSWGIIKSHCNIGGIHASLFSADGKSLYVAGMGYMRDPMAGNGRQLWQRFDWQAQPARKVDETHKGQSGEGLMETLAMHPNGQHFVMAGRLRGGSWNAALFDCASGELLQSIKTGFRVTHAQFHPDGKWLYLMGGQGQPKPKQGKFGKFGRLQVLEIRNA